MSGLIGTTLVQVSLFCLVGVANTLVDFVIFNLLSRAPERFSRIKANIVSTTVAMTFSFTANLVFVFTPHHDLLVTRTTRFLLVTLTSLYILQNVVIYLASSVVTTPLRAMHAVAIRFRCLRKMKRETIERNIAKLLATAASLVWNFLWYKFYVYAG